VEDIELRGDGLFDFLKKIDEHVQAEQTLINAWQEKDKQKKELS
jgi:hypothetical protein